MRHRQYHFWLETGDQSLPPRYHYMGVGGLFLGDALVRQLEDDFDNWSAAGCPKATSTPRSLYMLYEGCNIIAVPVSRYAKVRHLVSDTEWEAIDDADYVKYLRSLQPKPTI